MTIAWLLPLLLLLLMRPECCMAGQILSIQESVDDESSNASVLERNINRYTISLNSEDDQRPGSSGGLFTATVDAVDHFNHLTQLTATVQYTAPAEIYEVYIIKWIPEVVSILTDSLGTDLESPQEQRSRLEREQVLLEMEAAQYEQALEEIAERRRQRRRHLQNANHAEENTDQDDYSPSIHGGYVPRAQGRNKQQQQSQRQGRRRNLQTIAETRRTLLQIPIGDDASDGLVLVELCNATQAQAIVCPEGRTCHAYRTSSQTSLDDALLVCLNLNLCSTITGASTKSLDARRTCDVKNTACQITRFSQNDMAFDPCDRMLCPLGKICERYMKDGNPLVKGRCVDVREVTSGDVLNPNSCISEAAADLIAQVALAQVRATSQLIPGAIAALQADLEATQVFNTGYQTFLEEQLAGAQQRIEAANEVSAQVSRFQTRAEELAAQAQTLHQDIEANAARVDELNLDIQAAMNAILDLRSDAEQSLLPDQLVLQIQVLDQLAQEAAIVSQVFVAAESDIAATMQTAKASLRLLNDARLDLIETWRMTALLTLQNDTQRSANGLVMLAADGVRPQGFVNVREGEDGFFYRITFATQFRLDLTNVQTPSAYRAIADTDPDLVWVLQSEESPLSEDDKTNLVDNHYIPYMSSLGQTGLDVVSLSTAEFYCDPEFLLEQYDLWYTIKDLMDMLGPIGCEVPTESMNPAVAEEVGDNTTVFCNCWILWKRERCYRDTSAFPSVWTPIVGETPFVSFTNAPSLGNICDLGSQDTSVFYDAIRSRRPDATNETEVYDFDINGLSLLPQTELLTSHKDLNMFLQQMCQYDKTPGSGIYANTNLFVLNSSFLGIWFTVEPSFVGNDAARPSCSVHWDSMQVEVQISGNETIPHYFWRTAQIATALLWKTSATTRIIDKYGIAPLDVAFEYHPAFIANGPTGRLSGSTAAPRKPYDLQDLANNATFLTSSAYTAPPRKQDHTSVTSAYVSVNLIPIYGLRHVDTTQQITVTISNPNNASQPPFLTQVFDASSAVGVGVSGSFWTSQLLPENMQLGGYWTCVSGNCTIINGSTSDSGSFVFDFQAGDLTPTGSDPLFTQGRADYTGFFYDLNVSEGTFDFTQFAPFEFACDNVSCSVLTDGGGGATVTDYVIHRQTTPSVKAIRRQQKRNTYDPSKQGIGPHTVHVPLTPRYNSTNVSSSLDNADRALFLKWNFTEEEFQLLASDPLERKCDPTFLQQMKRTQTMGTYCYLLETRRLIPDPNNPFYTFDFDPHVFLEHRVWDLTFDILLPGADITLVGGGPLGQQVPLCPAPRFMVLQQAPGSDVLTLNIQNTNANTVMFELTITKLPNPDSELVTYPSSSYITILDNSSGSNSSSTGGSNETQDLFCLNQSAAAVGVRVLFETSSLATRSIPLPFVSRCLDLAAVHLRLRIWNGTAATPELCFDHVLNAQQLLLQNPSTAVLSSNARLNASVPLNVVLATYDVDIQTLYTDIPDTVIVGTRVMYELMSESVTGLLTFLNLTSGGDAGAVLAGFNAWIERNQHIRQFVLDASVNNAFVTSVTYDGLDELAGRSIDAQNRLYQKLHLVEFLHQRFQDAIAIWTNLTNEFNNTVVEMSNSTDAMDDILAYTLAILSNLAGLETGMEPYTSTNNSEGIPKTVRIDVSTWEDFKESMRNLNPAIDAIKQIAGFIGRVIKIGIKIIEGLVKAAECVTGINKTCFNSLKRALIIAGAIVGALVVIGVIIAVVKLTRK